MLPSFVKRWTKATWDISPDSAQPLPFAALDDREVDVVIGVNVLCSGPANPLISADITNGKLKIKRLWSLSGYDPFLRVYMRSPEVTEGSAGKCTQESETRQCRGRNHRDSTLGRLANRGHGYSRRSA